ncbi:hypothetical protein FA048_12595 [Pedobacter polaris]|uniref:Peptidase C39 domain-containing protein n=1 Tax=Pedobacter polaris TaxID=2571273 RepID=A0A4U1CL78_9SPHI|nr:thioredoxin domain-containing protein [Pedobacter polaris]TKC07997.1 hypothetical protein FA048_12595 [Pedobacter polaris]
MIKSNLEATVFNLIKTLKVKVTHRSVAECLEDHPEYPSLLSVSDCLSDWGLRNQSYLIDKAAFTETDMLFPFLAHLPEKGGRFMLVTSITDTAVFYKNESNSESKIARNEFLSRWDGIALHATADDSSGEQNYLSNLVKSSLESAKVPATFLLLVTIICWGVANTTIHLPIALLGSIKLLGLAISMLLVIQSINSNNPFIKNLCGLGGKNDCNAILKSDAAKLTSWLTWSDVGLMYFSCSFLLLVLDPLMPLLPLVNLLALPYTIYSVTYQYRAKNWCVLCCAVQLLLLLEAVTFWLSHYSFDLLSFGFSLNAISSLLVSLLLPVLIWAYVKPIILKASQLKSVKSQLKTFKYNYDLFHQALKNQPKYAISNDLRPIVLGNPKAETTITMVSNPFCGPCAKAHQLIDGWIKHREDIQLKVIFLTANTDSDLRTKVSRHLCALSSEDVIENAMNEWYSSAQKDYKSWAEKYPITVGEEMKNIMQIQNEWCDVAEIEYTPTIFLNGYKLPEPYRLEDIKYFLS